MLKLDDGKIEKKENCCFNTRIYIKRMDIVEMSIADEFLYDRNKETDAKCFIRYKTDKKN